MSPTVCLLSPAPLWVNPRLRKEADSLVAAGYTVLVAYRADGDVAADDAILSAARWQCTRIDLARRREPVRWAMSRARQRGAQLVWRAGRRGTGIAQAAYCVGDAPLLRWAKRQPADLYIGHTQPVLPIVARAASERGVPFAFDCEDLLAEELADGGRAAWRREIITDLERTYLPRAAYVSAPSQPMASHLTATYDLQSVRVWHNCFPAAESAGLLPPEQRPAGPTIDLAWISATIGPGRGLEDAFAAMRQLAPRATLHLYGAVPADAARWFDEHSAELRRRNAVVVHPRVAPDRIITCLANHQIGLALDGNDGLNRHSATTNKLLTASNKAFYYLQAGLACIATDTPGHRSVLPPEGGFGFLYPAGDVPAMVEIVQRLMTDGALMHARRAAWDVGHRTYVWDIEQTRFLDAVADALGDRQRGRQR